MSAYIIQRRSFSVFHLFFLQIPNRIQTLCPCLFFFLRYGLDTPDPPKYCNDCNTNFSICHALNCKWGGLVTARHNNLHDGVAELSGKAFTTTHVSEKTLIFAGCAVKRPKGKPSRYKSKLSMPHIESTEPKDNVLIRDL